MLGRDKTSKRWFMEWLGTLIVFILVVSALVYGTVINPTWGGILFPVTVIGFIAAFVLGLMLIARTVSLVMGLIWPEKKALAARFDREKIVFSLEKGAVVEYLWDDVISMAVSENFYGVYISTVKETQSYTLPKVDYKILEAEIDAALVGDAHGIVKSKDWIQSNQKGLDRYKETGGINRTYATKMRSRSLGRIMNVIQSEEAVEIIWYRRNG